MLASFCVVVCGPCGWCICHMAGARGASLFTYWIPVATTHPTNFPHPTPSPTLLTSATPDIAAMPVKASKNQAGETISND